MIREQLTMTEQIGTHPAAPWQAAALILVSTSFSMAQQDSDLSEPPAATLADVPIELPGHEEGSRTRTPHAESPTPTDQEQDSEPPEWFGGRPWGQWERATGNWGSVRDQLATIGFDFNGSYTGEWTGVLAGGVRERGSYRHIIDLNLMVDFEKLIGLEGGSFFIDYYSTSGRSLSADVGDYALVSNIETDGAVDQIAELWYEQWLFSRVLRLKFGKIEANSEFAFFNHGDGFINSGVGFPPTFQGFPTYPDPATGLVAFLYPLEQWYAGFGWFDGATLDGFATGGRGPATFFSDSKSDSSFFIGETGFTWETLGPFREARIAVGGLGHDADVDRFDGGTEDGAAQFYALAEALVWKRQPDDHEDHRGLAVVARYGWADDEFTDAGNYLAAGLQLNGTFDDRPDDATGIYASWLDLSDAEASGFDRDEWVIEWFYNIQVTPWFSVKPDIQYVIDPSGSSDTDDALVGMLRVEVAF